MLLSCDQRARRIRVGVAMAIHAKLLQPMPLGWRKYHMDCARSAITNVSLLEYTSDYSHWRFVHSSFPRGKRRIRFER
jgi:hypothetical protein